MAGDWIKMTHALPEKPEVLAIAGKTGLNRFEVVGRLFALWRWFDINTTDGNAPGVTSVTLEECLFGYSANAGFVAAVTAARWLVETASGLSVVKFDEHISESAKTRAQTAKRVAKSKAKAKGNAGGNGVSVTSSVTKSVPREEKRREEEIHEETTSLPGTASRVPPCPTTELIEKYHEHLPMLPRIVALSDSRKRAMSARWREVCASEKFDHAAGLDWFGWYFSHAAKSPFLTGKSKDWKADIDFLMNPQKFAKVVEGAYHKPTNGHDTYAR